MTRSMTGFASRIITLPLGQLTKVNVSLAIKSLNSRFFDSNCKLPYPLSNLETEFIKLFKNSLYRGYIHFTIHISSPDVFKGTVEPSLETIKGYLAAVEKIKTNYPVSGTLTISDLLTMPGVFSTYEQELDEQAKKILFDTAKDLLNDLIATQTTEGQALAKDLSERCALMTKEVAAIEATFGTVMVEQKQKVHATIQEVGMDESKLAEAHKNALYTMLDKLDIHEEIVRFKSHIKALETELNAASIEKGKRIDFILQELAREVNTMAAKCADSRISTHAINIKVELEKAREQAQNLV